MNKSSYTFLLLVAATMVTVAKVPSIIKNMNSDKIMYENKICHRNDTITDENRIKWDKPSSVMQVRDIETNALRILRASDSKQYNSKSLGYVEYIPASVRGLLDVEDFEDLAKYVEVIDVFDEWTVKTEFPTDSIRHFLLSYKNGDITRHYSLNDSVSNEIRISRSMFEGCKQYINAQLWYIDEYSEYLVSDSIKINLW